MKLRSISSNLFGLILLLALNQNVRRVSASESKEAYVTLLYGDVFVLGARVLGKSIRDTRSTKDMVLLVSDDVSNYAKNLLQKQEEEETTNFKCSSVTIGNGNKDGLYMVFLRDYNSHAIVVCMNCLAPCDYVFKSDVAEKMMEWWYQSAEEE
ncbi:hypothetical protein L1987_11615 [Smallanthus sonchifolius]|uniref:Uncharacterized protein n=1 Tax=Smallanthus sonchifolius TaxID=185202 RepID=A0ACB9JCD5_9ASTR|nr:hypothetical protein L1987_11615 [Smallanthus sonchifolius]